MASGIVHGETGASLSKTEMEGADLHEITDDLDVNTHKVVNVVDPTEDQHGATKKYVDDKFSDVSRARAYQSAIDQHVDDAQWRRVILDAESYDSGDEFDSTVKSGAADDTEADKLHDADGGFEAADVGMVVWNTTDDTYTTVAAFVDSGELTLADDIMVNGESYHLYRSRFTAAMTGYYAVCGSVRYSTPVADKLHYVAIRKNGSAHSYTITHSSHTSVLVATVADIVYMAASDYLELFTYQDGGAVEALVGHSYDTFLSIHRLS